MRGVSSDGGFPGLTRWSPQDGRQESIGAIVDAAIPDPGFDPRQPLAGVVNLLQELIEMGHGRYAS